jgi:hypothetical protein
MKNIAEALHKLYWKEKKSLTEIAGIYEKSPETIRRWMMRYSITRRSKGEAIRIKKVKNLPARIFHLYWKRKMTLKEIADLFKVSPQTVRSYMIKHGIPRRKAAKFIRKTITPEMLRHLYVEKRMSLTKLARYIGVRFNRAKKLILGAGITPRTRSETSLKYPRKPFSGDEIEKAYLLGFRTGDLTVTKDCESVRAGMGTTHPAQIKLFLDLFEKYGHCLAYPHKSNLFVYGWALICYLDWSFNFLLASKDSIRLPSNPKLFLAFLAGYADAEGYWKICKHKVWIEFRFEIETQDRAILKQIFACLRDCGYHPRFYVVKRKGKRCGKLILRKPMYRLSLARRDEVIELARTLLPFTKHEEKRRKMQLVLGARKMKYWTEVKNEIESFKRWVAKRVRKCKIIAEKEYKQRKFKIKGCVSTIKKLV